MKRKVLFLACLLLLIIGIFFALTSYRAKINLEDAENYNIYDDLPIIKASSSSYLLDPDFTVTPENLADCVDDYLSAPAMLYFGKLHTTMRAIKDPDKTSAFGKAFRDVSLVPISKEEYPDYDHYHELYHFFNAIGTLELRSWQEETYISFYLEGHLEYNTTYFRVQGDLISELNSIAESLKNDSVEVPLFEPPH